MQYIPMRYLIHSHLFKAWTWNKRNRSNNPNTSCLCIFFWGQNLPLKLSEAHLHAQLFRFGGGTQQKSRIIILHPAVNIASPLKESLSSSLFLSSSKHFVCFASSAAVPCDAADVIISKADLISYSRKWIANEMRRAGNVCECEYLPCCICELCCLLEC